LEEELDKDAFCHRFDSSYIVSNVENIKVMRISKQPSPVQTMIDQKLLENAQYFHKLSNLTTRHARRAREIKSRIAMAKAALNKKKTLFTSKLDLLTFKEKLIK
jgi:hypothetical protein